MAHISEHRLAFPPHRMTPSVDLAAEKDRKLPVWAQYGLTLLFVGAATLLAFVGSQVVAAANLTLIFVLPVVLAATAFGWGPSVAAIIASVLAYDFFFTRPYLTLRMTDPAEIWAAGFLLVTAAIVSTVAAQSRRRALDARRAADQAEALRALAHAVIERRSQNDILQTAAAALSRIFAAPAVVYSQTDGQLRVEATAGDAAASQIDAEAAACALEARQHMRGETYPNDQSRFDFWPVATPTDCRYILGVDFADSAFERPADPDRFIELVGAYVASNLATR